MKNEVFNILKKILEYLDFTVKHDGSLWDGPQQLRIKDRDILLTKRFVRGSIPFLPHKKWKMANMLVDLTMMKSNIIDLDDIKEVVCEETDDGKIKSSFLSYDKNVISTAIGDNEKISKTILVYKTLDSSIDEEYVNGRLVADCY